MQSTSSGDESDDATSTTSTVIKRRRTGTLISIMNMLFDTNIEIMPFEELSQSIEDMKHAMLECSESGLCEWPRRIMLMNSSANISLSDLDEVSNRYMLIFFYAEKVYKTMTASHDVTDEATTHELARLMCNLNGCRTLVVDALKSLQPLVQMIRFKQRGDAADADVASNEGILHTLSNNKKQLTSCQSLLKTLLETCLVREYRKCDGYIFEQMTTKEKNTHYWERKFDFKAFIHQECSFENSNELWEQMTASAGNVTAIEEQLRSGKNDLYLPVLERDRNIWSFKNGVYDGMHDKFYRFDCDLVHHEQLDACCGILHIKELPESVVSCKYFPNIDFNYYPEFKGGGFEEGKHMLIPTPSHDRVLNHQKFTDDVQNCIWAMGYGRMQYNIQDVDNKQVICFLVGMAGTGKSIWIDAVKHMYDEDDIGIVANTAQKDFGLDGIENRFMWLCSEVTSKFTLDQAKFQQIVSGEKISIDRKHQQAHSCQWTAPGLMAGNETPGYTDNANSVARRIMAVRFETMLEREAMDTTLSSKLKDEIAAAILKGNRAFHAMNRTHKNKNFWDFAPPYFSYTQGIMKCATNPLISFLTSGKLKYGKDMYIKEADFKAVFKTHCQENGFEVAKWNPDFFQGPFSSKGLTMGKNNNNKYEKLPWPVMWHNEHGQLVPGKIHNTKYVHGCAVLEEKDKDDGCQSS